MFSHASFTLGAESLVDRCRSSCSWQRVQDNCVKDRQIPFCVAEFSLVWPLVGVLGMIFALGA